MAFPLLQSLPQPSIVLGVVPDTSKELEGGLLLSWQCLPNQGAGETPLTQRLLPEDVWHNGNVFQVNPLLSDALRTSVRFLEGDGTYRFGWEQAPLLLSLTLYPDAASNEPFLELTHVGLCDITMPAVIARIGNPGEAYYHYRMLIMQYADMVMERTLGLNRNQVPGILRRMNRRSEWLKERKEYSSDQLFSAYDHAFLAGTYKAMCQATFGKAFPEDPWQQLEGLVTAFIRYGDPAVAREVVIRPIRD